MARSRKSKKKTEERVKKVIFKIFLFFLFGLFLVLGLYYLTNWSKFHVKNINIDGTEFIQHSIIENKIEEISDQDRLGIFSNRNILLFPKKIFLKEALETEKKIKGISLDKNWPNTLDIKIEERVPEHEWCDEKECYLMDSEGLIFSKKYNEESYLTFSGSDNLSSDKIIGSYYSNREDFKALNNFIRAAKNNFGLYFSNIKNNDEYSKILENVDGTKVVINNSVADEDLYNFSRILEESDLAVRDGKFIKGVDYINMIHGNKIFYCMKEGEDFTGNVGPSECKGNFDKE